MEKTSGRNNRPRRGRPSGRNRVPLNLEQRRARNALYERERREETARAWAELANALGCNVKDMAQSDLLDNAINFIQNNQNEIEDIGVLRERNKKLRAQLADCERRLVTKEPVKVSETYQNDVVPKPKRIKLSQNQVDVHVDTEPIKKNKKDQKKKEKKQISQPYAYMTPVVSQSSAQISSFVQQHSSQTYDSETIQSSTSESSYGALEDEPIETTTSEASYSGIEDAHIETSYGLGAKPMEILTSDGSYGSLEGELISGFEDGTIGTSTSEVSYGLEDGPIETITPDTYGLEDGGFDGPLFDVEFQYPPNYDCLVSDCEQWLAATPVTVNITEASQTAFVPKPKKTKLSHDQVEVLLEGETNPIKNDQEIKKIKLQTEAEEPYVYPMLSQSAPQIPPIVPQHSTQQANGPVASETPYSLGNGPPIDPEMLLHPPGLGFLSEEDDLFWSTFPRLDADVLPLVEETEPYLNSRSSWSLDHIFDQCLNVTSAEIF